MPCIPFVFNPRVGPIIQLAVLPPDAGGISSPSMDIKIYAALIDTGASNTCISSRIVKDVSLSPVGKVSVAGVHGSSAVNQYQFNTSFILPVRQEPSGTVSANLLNFIVQGTEFNNDGCGFDVLLGRDVICLGSLQMSFDGHGMLCF